MYEIQKHLNISTEQNLNVLNSKCESMKVSVIIPFRSKSKVVEDCINSVKKQDYKNIEIIAVSEIDRFNDKDVISILDSKCRGVGAKRNKAAKRASGDILFFLDSDCIVKNNTITKLVDTFEKSGADAVSGKTLTPKNSNLLGTVTGLEYEYRFDQMGENFVDVAATTCLGVKKRAFEEVWFWFKDYTIGEATGEDWDFSTRFRNKNFKIYHTNKVQVYHMHANEPLLKWFKRRIHHSSYRIIHYKKYRRFSDQYMSLSALFMTTLLLNIPATIKIYIKTRNAKIFLLPLYSLIRNIAWSIGVVFGIVEVIRNHLHET